MKQLLLLACLLLGPIVGSSAHQQQHKNVNVELRAKWSGTPLLLEIGELLAKEKPSNLWKFIENWLDRETSLSSSSSNSDCVQEIVSQGKLLVDGHLASLLQLSLSLRSASPKLVVYEQLAQESLGSVTRPGDGCCWVDVGSELLWEESQILDWLKSGSLLKNKVELHEFDHVHAQHSAPTAVLYGALGTTCFRKFHSILREASEKKLARYVYRPVLPSGCQSSCSVCGKVGAVKSMNLAGYGVELALKNMEYKAIDDSEVKAAGLSGDTAADDLSQEVGGFIFSKLLERKPHLEGELMTFRDHLLSSEETPDAMNAWEVKDLGYQATQRIVGASQPLRLMQELNQNFPNLVSSLSRMKVNETIKQEVTSNQQLVPPGRNLLAINGALVNAESLDLFTLIEMVHEELSFADKIGKMKVPFATVGKLLRLPEPTEQSVVRLDFRSDKFVHFLNDIENDVKYKRWSPNLQELLMPVFPGQLRYVRKNLFHAVYVIDPASMKGLKMVEMIMHYYHNNLPLRVGLILLSPEHIRCLERNENSMCNNDLSSLVIRLFLHLTDQLGTTEAFEFLNNILDADFDETNAEESSIEEAFVDSLRTLSKQDAMEVLSKLKSGNEYQKEAAESSEFVFKLGLSDMHPSLLMNGLVFGPSQAQSAVMMSMNDELPRLQEGVYFGNINSRTDILNKFLSEEGYKRYNPKIAGSGKYISLAPPFIDSHPIVASLKYLHSPGTEDDVKPVSHWLMVDFSKESGIRLLKQGVRYLLEGTSRARLSILSNTKSNTQTLLPQVFNYVMQQSSRRAKHLHFLQNFLEQYETSERSFEETGQLIVRVAEEAGLDSVKFQDDFLRFSAEDQQSQQEREFVYEFFGLDPGTNAVVTNGKLFVQDEADLMIAEDFSLLESIEYRRRIKDVQEIIEGVSWAGMEADDISSDFLSNIIMVVSSTMASRVRSSETARFELLKADHSAIVREAEGSPLQIDAVLNPLSAVAQKLTPLLVMLEDWLQPSIRIVMNPINSLGDVPLKNFYRYVLPSKDDFLSDGFAPYARFTNMPLSKTLTMNLDVPEPWLVEPVVAIHDLDNIVLEKLGNERSLHAVFELEALMITGHCYERNDPPRGLQLILGTKQHAHMVDTIVMANLGYFQLKAGPGAWIIRLADGKSRDLYTLRGLKEGTEDGAISREVVVADLRGAVVQLEVVKRRGKEDEKLLDADSKESRAAKGQTKSLFKWAADMIGVGGQRVSNVVSTTERHGETINIFSVASGHLYERFLKIMILSVLKNTRRPVKFWFIKNYLSPQFKDVIPHMASQYGFEFELVTYKWPSWLHKQTEKQRIIWAYKILFLDVIFPLSLKKVIFVDADQIVRADMGELYDMDIKGRPLAYTPFCDNNKDMDGYRFWSQGFWKDHLQGKPYHISALYVVDLEKFRQTAAGDNLRVFYESLSKDPNSLSNLDQDLPNYAQHTVPIFSLPQEWLWCESWCGNATKSRAKTIDLCNNPMTKEPKLQGARRIVAEWPALDSEAREFTKKILGEDDAIPSAPIPSSPSPTPSPSRESSPAPSDGKDEL